MAMATTGLGIFLALAFFIGAYFFAVWDSRRDDSDAKDDGQIGLKIVLFTLVIASLGVAAGGVNTLLHYIVSGAKGGSGVIKSGAAGVVSGGGILAAVMFMFLPRTNSESQPKAMRMCLGFVSAVSGVVAVMGFTGFVNMMINGGGAPWVIKSAPLAMFLTYGGLCFLALNKLGGMSGWSAPARPAAPMGGGMPQQGGYPPQGGMPPQQGGYPPQGGMPPQGGGYPPQGGGYPPQGGGGYPPQGGGYPPQGGGYPPR